VVIYIMTFFPSFIFVHDVRVQYIHVGLFLYHVHVVNIVNNYIEKRDLNVKDMAVVSYRDSTAGQDWVCLSLGSKGRHENRPFRKWSCLYRWIKSEEWSPLLRNLMAQENAGPRLSKPVGRVP
jgi:hypothetical protein